MRRTPLHDEHLALGGKVVDFHGWALPVQFAGIIEEHNHTRTKAALFDCSHMGEFVLKGAEAIAAFDRVVFSDMINLRLGLCRYSAILNEQGGVIDDCVGLKLADDELYLVTNAGPLDEVHALIGSIPGVENVSDATAKIDIQGPLARDIMLASGFEAVGPLKYWNGARMTWEGHEIVVTRAGYTGEVGYEIFVPNALAVPLWERLAAHPDVACCGLGARDTLRLEAGMNLYGQDMDEEITPYEAGLRWTVDMKDAARDFIGKSALVTRQPRNQFQGLLLLDRGVLRAHQKVITPLGTGETTSGSFSPSLNQSIALARLPEGIAPGSEVDVEIRDKRLKARVVKPSFVRNGNPLL